MTDLKITYVGLATTLIRLAGQSFLANPNFSPKILFTKRGEEPALRPEAITPITGILITDSRYPHLDLFSFKYFPTHTPIFCPKGLGSFIRKFLPNPLFEIPKWSFHREGDLEIHAVPMRYFGFRWLPIRNRAASGFVLKSPQGTILYCAGTGYSSHFGEISSLFQLTAAILPVGLAHPGWPQKGRQLTPEEALRAFRELRAPHCIPIPDTSSLVIRGKDSLLTALAEETKGKEIEARLHFLKVGQTLEIK